MSAYPFPAAPSSAPTATTTDPTAVFGRRVGAIVVDFLLFALIMSFVNATPLSPLAEFYEIPDDMSTDGACDAVRDLEEDVLNCVVIGDRAYFTEPSDGAIAFAVWVATVGLYAALQGATGVTPGKAIFGIKAVDERGGKPRFGRSLGRTLLWVVDAAPWCLPLVGFITGLTTKGHRRVGDMACKTFVVGRAHTGPVVVPGLATADAPAGPWGPQPGSAGPPPWGGPPPQPAQPSWGPPSGTYAPPGASGPPTAPPGAPPAGARPIGPPPGGGPSRPPTAARPAPPGAGAWNPPGAASAPSGETPAATPSGPPDAAPRGAAPTADRPAAAPATPFTSEPAAPSSPSDPSPGATPSGSPASASNPSEISGAPSPAPTSSDRSGAPAAERDGTPTSTGGGPVSPSPTGGAETPGPGESERPASAEPAGASGEPTDATSAATPGSASTPTGASTAAGGAAAPSYNPQWDAARGTYILWEPQRGQWLGWDEASKQWRPL